LFYEKLTILTWYNDELTNEEKNRRLNMLDPDVTTSVTHFLRSLETCPKPTFWHFDDEVGMTDEEWDSAFSNFAKNREAISSIPQLHFFPRQVAASAFWAQQREDWRSGVVKELEQFRKDKTWAESCMMPKLNCSRRKRISNEPYQ
jgi:hypothetical protein